MHASLLVLDLYNMSFMCSFGAVNDGKNMIIKHFPLVLKNKNFVKFSLASFSEEEILWWFQRDASQIASLS